MIAYASSKKSNLKSVLANLLFLFSINVAVLFLIILLMTILNNLFGYVVYEYEKSPESLSPSGADIGTMTERELILVLEENVSSGLFRRYNFEKPLEERSGKELLALIMDDVVKFQVTRSWSLLESIFGKKEIERIYREEHPDGVLEFRSWINVGFLTSTQSSVPDKAGLITAFLGTLFIVILTVLIATPLGLGAAIYLEEYAKDNILNRIIKVNIYNLAGVPSIVFGLLGLSLFVRLMAPVTSGAIFNMSDSATLNGRTILSASLTLALLILPIIIINSQEAVKGVSTSIKMASYGLGGTKWQTIWNHVLPNCTDRILTGVILSVSRAIGETAPLVVIGASTFITQNPTSIFSKFTTITIQIYQWTARPQPEFKHIASAGILVLIVLVIILNSSAIITRNRLIRKRSR